MTANQRRPGFRLPWSSDMDEPAPEADSATAVPAASPAIPSATPPAEAPPTGPTTPAPERTSAPTDVPASPDAPPVEAATVAAPSPAPDAASSADGDDFMRDLVAAMRRVADEARDAGVTEIRAHADERKRELEADANRRREELRVRAEADVAAVGEWAKAEAERISREAEQRVAARRGQLEQQLAAETSRAEADAAALSARVAEYERELEAFHAQLGEIGDPAAFAAAAKRMPKPPSLTGVTTTAGTSAQTPPSRPTEAAGPGVATATRADEAPVGGSTAASNGVPTPGAAIHPAEEEVLAGRLAELDATFRESGAETTPSAPVAEPVTTEVVVKGLGSFGAITGFRQSLSGVEGVDGVALSLGQTGEFVFRATHAAGFDLRGAISALEGEGAKIEERPEGGLRVTLDRAR